MDEVRNNQLKSSMFIVRCIFFKNILFKNWHFSSKLTLIKRGVFLKYMFFEV